MADAPKVPNGNTSSISTNKALKTLQTRIDAVETSEYLTDITPGTAEASKAVVLDASAKIDTLDITSLDLNGTTVDATADEIDVLAGVTAGTSAANKAVVLDGSSQIDVLDIVTHTITTGTPVNAVVATATLTISGVALDSETVTVGADVYEFAADAAQTVTGSNIAVDITSYTTASQGTLTVDTQPTSGDTMTIGTKVYTFVPDGTANADGEISVGTNLASAQTNIVAAINGTDGFNTAHTQVSAAAFATDASVITALIGGVAGDSIASTETFTAGTNVFDGVTLGTTTGGADCTAANAVTALVAAEVASGTEPVEASDGAGDTVVYTANTKGTAANSIATTETMSNGAFGDVTLTGGVDGTLGTQWEARVDASYLYIAVDDNTISDTNWRRVSLGTVY